VDEYALLNKGQNIFRDLCTEDDFAFKQGKNAGQEGVYV
jgi:hypothetical protein